MNNGCRLNGCGTNGWWFPLLNNDCWGPKFCGNESCGRTGDATYALLDVEPEICGEA